MKKKILVTGGAGYIGSHLVARALEKNRDVVVVDNLTTGHRAAVPKGVPFYKVDLRDRNKLRQVFEKERPDSVIHFAAASLVAESVAHPNKYFDNNTYSMVCLLEAMKHAGTHKIIFSSTAATYGIPKKIPIKESDPANPINPYGDSKRMMERNMHWAGQAYGVRGLALRYFNVAGAAEDGSIGEDHKEETHLIPNVLFAASGKTKKITIYGDDYDTPDGFNVRDYVHPTDLADAHLLALDHIAKSKKQFDIFNLGSSTGFSVKEIVDATEKVTGKKIPHEIGPRRPGDPDTLVADSTKAREILGWKPQYDSVEDIIRTAWNWTQKHPNGYDDK